MHYSGSLLRHFISGDYELLQAIQPVRCCHDGICLECGAHGAEGRGIWVSRQDLSDEGSRGGPGYRGGWGKEDPSRAQGGRGRHLAHVSDEGRGCERLGQARC